MKVSGGGSTFDPARSRLAPARRRAILDINPHEGTIILKPQTGLVYHATGRPLAARPFAAADYDLILHSPRRWATIRLLNR
jgi:hypothetical protein